MIEHSELTEGYLLLEDRTVYKGKLIGAQQKTFGEICFNTGMTGYQEIFTDPSYKGQIVVLTAAHIGNYGIHAEETESNQIQIDGLVLKNYSVHYSRSKANDSLDGYLKKYNKTALVNVDTRALVRHIRNKGAMNAAIAPVSIPVDQLFAELKNQPSMAGRDLTEEVSTKQAYWVNPEGQIKIALLDFGVKTNIIRCLVEREAAVKVFPSLSTFEELTSIGPDGIMLSNGPGDPSVLSHAIHVTRKILDAGIPLFGICLGHQILAKALGLSTYKMFNGHRGLNHPILNTLTQKGEITSQNHGFAVVAESELINAQVTHLHLNDGTIAGIRATMAPAFSVQYHPESSPGPHDSRYLFDQFIETIKNKKYEWNSTHTRTTNS
jgi:carbamoyl-phosphate synthase small subunit